MWLRAGGRPAPRAVSLSDAVDSTLTEVSVIYVFSVWPLPLCGAGTRTRLDRAPGPALRGRAGLPAAE